MSGGLSGSQTTEAAISPWLEELSQRMGARAAATADLGYQPYMGPSVAAFSPMQVQAFRGVNDAAGAFGLPQAKDTYRGLTGMARPDRFAGGVAGYSSYPGFAQAHDQWARAFPGQAAAYGGLFPSQHAGRPEPAARPGRREGGR